MPDVFLDIDETESIDLDAARDRTPKDATNKGLYFKGLIDQLPDGDPWKARSYAVLSSYPMVEFLDLLVHACAVLHPDVGARAALRRIGLGAYGVLTGSAVGKMMSAFAGQDLDLIFKMAPRAYALSGKPITVSSTRVADRHWRLLFEGAYIPVDCYQVGVLEGAILATGHEPNVRARVITPTSCELDVQW